jgi:hypothetical protein
MANVKRGYGIFVHTYDVRTNSPRKRLLGVMSGEQLAKDIVEKNSILSATIELVYTLADDQGRTFLVGAGDAVVNYTSPMDTIELPTFMYKPEMYASDYYQTLYRAFLHWPLRSNPLETREMVLERWIDDLIGMNLVDSHTKEFLVKFITPLW